MTTGQPARFATEFTLEAKSGGVWMFGHFRFWCGGVEVGGFDVETSLRDLLFSLEGMRRDIGKRHSERFWRMSPESMFRLVDSGLFGDPKNAPYELADNEQWARHNITPTVTTFDGWKIYIVESDTVARIVFSASPYASVEMVEVDAGEVDGVLESTRVALEEIYNAEVAVEGGS